MFHPVVLRSESCARCVTRRIRCRLQAARIGLREGVQHVAIATADIVATVTELQNRGVEFLKIPSSYYVDVLDRVGKIDEDLAPLSELGILIDKDDEGYLLQIFSKPLQDRPTLFFEIIQRKVAKSFGKGNFKALFEDLEREQELRVNL